jgi:secondary thiamine-phosphate synthase enzyme
MCSIPIIGFDTPAHAGSNGLLMLGIVPDAARGEKPWPSQRDYRTRSSARVTEMTTRITVQTRGQGLHEITRELQAVVRKANCRAGLCTVMITHTSASLTIQENADPSARRDLEAWLNRLVAEGDALYTHTLEGADDMPSHIKAALTATSLSIPIVDGRLGLGTWQGIYVWEHRRAGGSRHCLVNVIAG